MNYKSRSFSESLKKATFIFLLIFLVAAGQKDIKAESDLDLYLSECCEEQGISYELMESIAFQESSMDFETVDTASSEKLDYSFNARNVTKYSDCRGIFQISTIHTELFDEYDVTAEDLYDPYISIKLATVYMGTLAEEYPDSPCMALMIYSGIPEHRASERDMAGDYPKYVTEVLNRAAELEKAHGK